jgi:hypothetical protein
LEDRVWKENKGIYMQVAIKVKEKIYGSFHSGWDGEEDCAEFQEKRAEILKELGFLIQKQYVRTYEDVKNYFNK